MKWPKVTKTFFYWAWLHNVNQIFLPFDIPQGSMIVLTNLTATIDFIGLYNHWWPSLALSMLQVVFIYLSRWMFYDLAIDFQVVVDIISNVLFVGMFCWACHLVI